MTDKKAQDYFSWGPGKVCGALNALFEARTFGPRTRDNIIMYDLGKTLAAKGRLTPRQIDVVRSKLPRYASALAKLNIVEVPIALPDGNDAYKFAMHNPTTLRVYSPPDSPILLRIRRIAGFQEHPDGFFTVPFSHRNAYVLLHNGFVMGNRVQDFMDRGSTPLPFTDFTGLRRELKDYQKEGVRLLLARQGRALLADEQGLGKTGQAIAWAELAKISKICIVCPASLKANWQREIELWTGSTDSCVISGKSAHVEGLHEIMGRRWIIINYDILSAWRMVLGHSGIKAFIFDEAQALKSFTSKRSQISSQLAKKVQHVLMLSGTPVENRPAEFLPLIQMIDPLLFPSKIKYQERYCDLHQNALGFMDVSGASNTLELHKILSETIMIRRKKADVLTELPEKQRVLIPLRLPASALRTYMAAEQDFTTWLKMNSPTTDARKMRKKLRAQAMIKVGVLKDLAAQAKLPLVQNWIQTYLENEAKLVVFAEHHKIIDALRKEYGKSAVVIDGRVPSEKRQEICDAFQTNPQVKLLIGNIKAAGTGLTLTAAKDTLTVEFAWTSTAHDQCEDRVHRIGQKNAVMAYYLLAEGTIEERIAALLDSKRTIITQIMDGESPEDEDLFDSLLDQYTQEAAE